MAERIVRVEPVMGTMVSVDVRDEVEPDVATRSLDAFFEALREIDRRFSPWRADSEISALSDGRLLEAEASPDLRWILAVCDHLAITSGGAFDARHHRADGRVDPSGFVKGWAIEEAAATFSEHGLRNVSINAGGDILATGRPSRAGEPARGWRVGIRHPHHADRIAATLEVADQAVATSGLYERGDHLRDARTSAPPRALSSLTVVGPSLAWADAYATAAFVMGLDGPEWVASHAGYGALAITPDERLHWTETIAPILTNLSRPAA
jgi:thiamine biosynthesis lipoprotein